MKILIHAVINVVIMDWRLVAILFTRDSIYAIARICYRPSVRQTGVS